MSNLLKIIANDVDTGLNNCLKYLRTTNRQNVEEEKYCCNSHSREQDKMGTCMMYGKE